MNEYGTSAPNLASIVSEPTKQRHAQQLQRRNEEFLRGPIPLWWLAAATRCGKLALSVGLLIWFRWGCNRSRGREAVTVSARQYQSFGLSSDTFSRGLKKLEAAELAIVDRQPGRKPRIAPNLRS